MEGIGVKGIIVGNSTKDDVIKKFGKNYKMITYESYSKQLQYKEIGLSFFYCRSDNAQKIFSIEMRKPFDVTTGKGIVLGKSTVADVIRQYGESETEESISWLEYTGVDFRNVNLVTNEINFLNNEMVINEINIYAPDFKSCN